MDNRQEPKKHLSKEELRKLLPYGGLKDIAKRANVTPGLVSHYFCGLNNSKVVEAETYKYLAEIAENRRKMLINILSE